MKNEIEIIWWKFRFAWQVAKLTRWRMWFFGYQCAGEALNQGGHCSHILKNPTDCATDKVGHWHET